MQLRVDGAWSDHWTKPREWQRLALEAIRPRVESGESGVVHAIMGSGKSLVIAELCRLAPPKSSVVLTVPTVRLVDQLSETLERRVGDCVGRYYTYAHDTTPPYIVACMDSAPALGEELRSKGTTVDLWIADECHRTENRTMHDASQAFEAGSVVGFSATPFLADRGRGLSIFDACFYAYSLSDAIRDQVVVPWRIVPWTGGECGVDEACVKMISGSEGPGIANALTISDAEAFSEILGKRGVAASAIHSRLSRSEQSSLLLSLERGELHCLVHVSLLSEGVDFPWLRWMCLRRPVSSRVRFAQEVGRVLRASPDTGKTCAVLYDPQDLFGEFQLTYEAVLGGEAMIEDDGPKLPADKAAQAVLQIPTSALQKVDSFVLSKVGRYLRQLSAVIEASARGNRIAVGKWRGQPPSQKQLDCIERVAPSLRHVAGMPPNHHDALAACWTVRNELSKGQASDFLTILFGLVKTPRTWPELAEYMSDEGVSPPKLLDLYEEAS